MKNVVCYTDSSGSRWWRFLIPFRWMNKDGWNCYISDKGINEQEVKEADIIVLHNIINKEGIAEILALREMSNFAKKIVVDMDDAPFVNPDNPHKKHWEVTNAEFVIQQTLKVADVVTCTTETLKEKLLEYNKNVVVLPNYYDPDWFNVVNSENRSPYLRIGWAGSITHSRDIETVAPLINELMKIYPIKFIICGDPRFKDLLENKSMVEVYPSTSIEFYPNRLSSMALDIGIAPLVDDEFNSLKSNIKAMEYSLLKIPSVVSYETYKDVPTSLKCKTLKEWETALISLIESEKKRKEIGELAYEWVTKTKNIKDHYKEWINTYD